MSNKEHPKSFSGLLKNGEKVEIALKTWNDHIMARHEIKSFTTLAEGKLFHVAPQEDQVFLPFSEYNGDHSNNWIIAIDMKTSEEFFRKNIRLVDMIDWKLSSS